MEKKEIQCDDCRCTDVIEDQCQGECICHHPELTQGAEEKWANPTPFRVEKPKLDFKPHAPSEERVPCDCPKGGMDVDGRTCDKCHGTEWIDNPTPPSEEREPIYDCPDCTGDEWEHSENFMYEVCPRCGREDAIVTSLKPNVESEPYTTTEESSSPNEMNPSYQTIPTLPNNLPPSPSEEAKDEIYNLLHDFHLECLREPFSGQPLQRRARKNWYTDLIYEKATSQALTQERERLAREIEGMKKKIDLREHELNDLFIARYNQALSDVLSKLSLSSKNNES